MDLDPSKLIVIVSTIMVGFTFVGVTWKLLRFIFKVDKALPTLLAIAGQFETNSGKSLKDSIDAIRNEQVVVKAALEVSMAEQKIENRTVLKIAEDSRLVANTNAAIVNELVATHQEDLAHIKEYLHDKMHDLQNQVAVSAMAADVMNKRSIRIEERLDRLIPLLRREKEDNGEE